MDRRVFNCLKGMAKLVADNAAEVPSGEANRKFWHGAAFEVLGTRCVVSADDTRMIVDLTPAIPIPGVKKWVRGLANIGGRVVSIADLSSFLSGGERSSSGKQALIINGRGIHTGLIIDSSFGGVRFDIDELRTDQPVAENLQPFVSGVFSAEDGDYALLDINLLLTNPDFMEAGVVTTN
jgi:twitching motility protein PilI